MKTVKLNLIKKNRVYFKCINEKGYEVKLKINEKSESLPLGEQELLVNDISVVTKYGTDTIYEMEAEIKDARIVTLTHRYNKNLVESCRELGGKWDATNKAWVFTKLVEDKVEELDDLYNSDITAVEITANEEIFRCNDSVHFLGYPIAKATGRDSGAVVCDDVSLVNGDITSDGSRANWGTCVKEGAAFRLLISKKLLLTYKPEKPLWLIKEIYQQ